MIRVNLLKTNVSTVSEGLEDESMAIPDFGEEESEGNVLVNFVLILIFSTALWAYDNHATNIAKKSYNKINGQLNRLRAEVKKKEKEAKKVEGLKAQLEDIESKKKALEDLTKRVMIELKALDLLQSIIPDRVWLTDIVYGNNKFTFKGYAISDEDLSEFLRLLEERAFYEEVILLQATEEEINQGTAKSFEVTSRLGAQNGP